MSVVATTNQLLTSFKEFLIDLEEERFDNRSEGVIHKPNLVGQHHDSAGGTSDLIQ